MCQLLACKLFRIAGLLLLAALVSPAFVSSALAASPHVVTQSSPITLCMACHVDPNSATDGIWVPSASPEQEVLCLSCHNPTGAAVSLNGNTAMADVAVHKVQNNSKTIYCATCHNPHGPENSTDPRTGVTAENLKLVRSSWSGTYVKVPNAVGSPVFQVRPQQFAQQTAPFNGICNACHTATFNHSNGLVLPDSAADGTGNKGHNHNIGAICTECHLHKEGFLPRGAGDCNYCHVVGGFATNFMDGFFQTSGRHRRPILGAGGDYQKTSHHVRGGIVISDCRVCHELTQHSMGIVRLKDQDNASTVYQYDPNNNAGLETFCLSCHDSNGATIGGGLTPFSDAVTPPNIKAGWPTTAHKVRNFPGTGQPLTCIGDGQSTGCHINAHASDNEKILNLTAGLQVKDLCLRCHTDGAGKVQNNSISMKDSGGTAGVPLATSISAAFAFGNTHPLGQNFTIASAPGYTFSLQCTSCHNPHVVTGKYWDAATGQTPITMPDFSRSPTENPRAMGYTLWGDDANEKAGAYASAKGGTYVAPTESDGAVGFTGTQLPDYSTFCLSCHDGSGMPFDQGGQISWDGDPHGGQSANMSNGFGTCPNWFGCGKAKGWDGDDCVGTESECWPVVIRGRGGQAWTREPFMAEQRFAGANFVLQCVNCHEAHGSPNAKFIRTDPNAGTGTTIWNTMCNNCHWYYTDWHAGMSCASASCHATAEMSARGGATIHRMGNNTGAGGTMTWNKDLVLDMRFENNLNDSGTWNLHGQWFSGTTGTFAAGKSGQAAVFSGTSTVQLGTRNASWANDESAHGTWKFFQMKYNTTLEAWVKPTDTALTKSEYSIFTMHTGYSNGGYAFVLRNVGGVLKPTFYMAADNNSFTQGGNAGVRGAYSSVAVPLNTWSHVAVTFDKAGLGRSVTDRSVGRIRIYVNGEDVTTSDFAGSLKQPGASETSIFNYSENSKVGDSVVGDPNYQTSTACYLSYWCAFDFSVGGFYNWQNTFIGMIDEAKVWNITKPTSYFTTYDQQSSPRLLSAGGSAGSNQLILTFSEGVYRTGGVALTTANFSYTDADNSRTITAVSHTAGSNTVTLTLSSALDATTDIGTDNVTTNGVYDNYNNASDLTTATVSQSAICPSGSVAIELNEAAGSAYVTDNSGYLVGTVTNSAAPQALDGSAFTGNGTAANYVTFNNSTCLQATTAMTLESRFYIAAGAIAADATTSYVKRIFAHDGAGNYQLSVWRNLAAAAAPTFPMLASKAAIALWVMPQDAHTGATWKPIFTDHTLYPVTNGHWYKVKAVWNTAKTGGVIGSPYVPADIFLEDQGTDGAGAGKLWTGYVNATHSAQTWQAQSGATMNRLYTGDMITPVDANFWIGAANNPANNRWNGKIDYIYWKDTADYTGVTKPADAP